MSDDYIIQDPPFCVQVELTEGCNLFCDFCGLRGIRERPNDNLKFMTPVTAGVLASMIQDARRPRWNPRIEFAMHGEPTLNPEVLEILTVFRGLMPNASLMMLSNGGGIAKQDDPVEFIHELRRHGLNTLAIENYSAAPGLFKRIKEAVDEDPHLIYHWYPDDKDYNPHQRVDPDLFRLVFIRDIGEATTGTHASLNTHCGCGAPPKVLMEPCGKPFRELSVRWDGGVAICCNDWRGEYVIGNLDHYGSMRQLWLDEKFIAARKKLLHGHRDFTPCDKCDAKTYRPGLLPDPKGKETLAMAGLEDDGFIALAHTMGPLVPPVLRPWE